MDNNQITGSLGKIKVGKAHKALPTSHKNLNKGILLFFSFAICFSSPQPPKVDYITCYRERST